MRPEEEESLRAKSLREKGDEDVRERKATKEERKAKVMNEDEGEAGNLTEVQKKSKPVIPTKC